MKIKFLVLAAMLLSFSLTAFAQTSRGTVSGTVTDQAGAVVPGANVTLTNAETSLNRTTVTNGEGFYRFDAVDPSTYNISITAANFGEVTKTNIIVQANQIADVPATLQPGNQQVTVDVSAEAGQLLQTEAPVRGGNIDPQRIRELPFAGRNPVALALTLPGVSSNRFGFGTGTFSVNGARGRSNNFLIDGTENNDISIAGQGFQITNPDAVQEVSVQTSNYDAEFGRAGGAVVNTITKSGTNAFHGTLSYLLDSTRDDALTSAQGRDPVQAQRGRPAPGTEQYFSGTLGGPLFLPRFGEGGKAYSNNRERTFFFGAFQEQRQNSSGRVALTVPSAAGRARLLALFPAGTNSNVDTFLNVTNGTAANATLFNIALGASPITGVDRGSIEFGTFNRSFARANRDRQSQIRIDHKISENDQLSSRYLYDDAVFPQGGDVSFEGFNTPQANRYQNFLLAETHVFSPNLTNEARIAYNRIKLSFPVNTSNPLGNTLPLFNITNVTSLGVASNLPQGRIANNYVFQDTVTYLSGKNTFRFGTDILDQRSRQIAPFRGRGELTFASSTVGSTSFTGFANFVDNFGGGSGSALRDFGSSLYYPRLIRQAYFFQDRIKATEALTLTLGVRYENFGVPFNSLRTPAFTGLFNVDPVTLTGPFDKPNSIPHDNNNFAPTLGIAYSPSFTNGFLGRLIGEKKTVFRAGYQIGYDSFFNNIASNAAGTSPNLISTSTTSTANAANPRGLANLTGAFPTVARALTPRDSQTLIDAKLVNPYYQRFSAGLQRELPFKFLVDVAYVGSRGVKLFDNEDRNPLVPAALRITPAGFTGSTTCTPGTAGCLITGRLDNLQGARLTRSNSGSSTYHSGQLNVTRRFANNFAVTAAYTYSKLIDNASEVFGSGGNNQPQNQAIPVILGGERIDRAVSLFDRTHRASFTYGFGVPFFREQRGFAGRALGGFEITGVTTFETGAPLNVTNGVDADAIGGNFDRPDFNPNGRRGVRAIPATTTSPSSTGFVNPDVVTGTTAGGSNIFQPIDPATAQYIGLPSGSGRTGSLGRNTLRTPGTNNFNVNVLKRTRITEKTNLEFRTEFYNIFNHPQFTQGSVSPFDTFGGGSIPANVFNSQPGEFLNPDTRLSNGGGRVIRYQLKFIF